MGSTLRFVTGRITLDDWPLLPRRTLSQTGKGCIKRVLTDLCRGANSVIMPR